MILLPFPLGASPRILVRTYACLGLIGATCVVQAAEGFKLRQPPFGLFGGELAAPLDNSGFFGTASLTYSRIEKLVDGAGNNMTVSPRSIPLPTGTPTGGVIPNGTYTLSYGPGNIDIRQSQATLNLVGGYLTETEYAAGHLAFAVNVPLIKQSRSFTATQFGAVSPIPPAALQVPVNAVASAVNGQVQAVLAAQAASQNAEVSGFGDTEISALWIRHSNQLKVAAGASLYLPTGTYDKNRGPNPGSGNFYTLRPGVAVSYEMNPDEKSSSWDSGVTVGGRLSYGINSTNKETNYRSGNFVYAETGAVKVSGNWAYGANLMFTQQVTDDSGAGSPKGGNRYRTFSAGPFLSYKLPGKDAGINLHFSQNFGGRNAIVAQSLQLRLIKAW